MKATGIVRRIDDLGRVVIPKEIRRNLHLKEGDPLELFVEDGAVVFRKYSFFNMEDYPKKIRRILRGTLADKEWALYDDYHQITKNLNFPENTWSEWEGREIKELPNTEHRFGNSRFTIYPILASGDLLGYFATTQPGAEIPMLVKMIAYDYEND